MISLSESLLSAAGLFRLGGVTTTLPDEPGGSEAEGRNLSPDAVSADDPFFLAVAEALREAGYLDS